MNDELARSEERPLSGSLFKGATETHMPELEKPHPLEWYLSVPAQLAEADRMSRSLQSGLEWWRAELIGVVFSRFGDVHEGSELYSRLEEHLDLKYGSINSLLRAYQCYPNHEDRIPDVGPYAHAELGKLEPAVRDLVTDAAINASNDPDAANWTRNDLREERKRIMGIPAEKKNPTAAELGDLWRRAIRNARPSSNGWYEIPFAVLDEVSSMLDEHVSTANYQGVVEDVRIESQQRQSEAPKGPESPERSPSPVFEGTESVRRSGAAW